MSLIPGLVSVTFRKLSTREIVSLVNQAGFKAIEWGGDVHAPPGHFALAREVRKQTEDAGLLIGSYGSYYRAGTDMKNWPTILNTAEALGTDNIRIWAGGIGSADTPGDLRKNIIDDIRAACESAGARQIRISLEYHGNTLTDTPESTHQLLREVGHSNLYIYWQPSVMPLPKDREAALVSLINQVSHVHVFQWKQGTADRQTLAEGANDWKRYLSHLAATGKDHGVFMEFVKNDSPEQFLADAAELKKWLAEISR